MLRALLQLSMSRGARHVIGALNASTLVFPNPLGVTTSTTEALQDKGINQLCGSLLRHKSHPGHPPDG